MATLFQPHTVAGLSFWLSALMVYLLWRYGYRPLLLDVYKAKIFELRAKLFDLAADGVFDFEEEAYWATRDRLNARAGYAHRLSLVDFLITRLFIPDFEDSSDRVAQERQRILDSATTVAGRAAVEQIEDQADEISVIHFVIVTPLAWVLAVFAACTALARRARKGFRIRFRSLDMERIVGRSLLRSHSWPPLLLPFLEDQERAEPEEPGPLEAVPVRALYASGGML